MAWSYQADSAAVPALFQWRMLDLGALVLAAPALLDGAGGWVEVGAVAARAPASVVCIGESWRGRVQSEALSTWAGDWLTAWRRFRVVASAESEIADVDAAVSLVPGLPVDIISLPVLATAIGTRVTVQSAPELIRLRAMAYEVISSRVTVDTPADLVQGAVASMVGYYLERPNAASSAWSQSGAAALLSDWVGLVR